jgi:hypothetical protein
MLSVVVELFVNNLRTFKTIDLKGLAHSAYPQALSVGIATGLFDQLNHSIATNNFVSFKGNLCRLTIDDGQVMIKHPKHGLCPLWKYHSECKVIK